MLVVRTFGGLGNQMSQYVFYQYLKKNNESVFFDTSDFLVHKHHYGFELPKVFENIDYAVPPKAYEKVVKVKNSIVYRLIGKLGFSILYPREYRELSFHSLVKADSFKTDVIFTGFWQDRYYIDCIGLPAVQQMFKIKEPQDSKNREFLEMTKSQNVISVHIRRGDYVKIEDFNSICTLEYYHQAIEKMKEAFGNSSVFAFFSDDIPWCRQTFGEKDSYIFVDWNQAEKSHYDMCLMSHCKGNIIANSTFSLWAAYLNKNQNRKVIAPAQWTIHTNSKSLVMDDWWTI